MVAMVRLWWKRIKTMPILILLNSCLQQIKHHKVITLLIPFFIALALTVLIGGYRLNWVWTGFTGTNETYKTLYDWLQLLFVPLALAGFGFYLNYRERKAAERHADKERQEEERRVTHEQKAAARHAEEGLELEQQRAQTERDIALDNQREAALQAYLDRVSELLLQTNFSEERPDENVFMLIRARTLTTLKELDPERKTSLFGFLWEAGLIGRFNLDHADFSGADLSGANLRGAKLRKANLSRANLHGVTLDQAELLYTNLKGANLSRTMMYNADLRGADLTDADLTDAYLTKANLEGAVVTTEQLKQAKP